MLKWLKLIVLALCCTGCVLDPVSLILAGVDSATEDATIYEPKLEKSGPEFLYGLKQQDVPQYFPIGAQRDQIEQRFGKPTHAGTGWAGYVNSRQYTHYSRNQNYLYVAAHYQVTLTYDGNGKLTSTNLSATSSLSESLGRGVAPATRTPSEAELARYLGPLPAAATPLAQVGSKASPVAYAAIATTKQEAGAPVGWRLGIAVANQSAGVGGAEIRSIEEGGLADKAGLKAGDILLKLNNAPIQHIVDFVAKLKSASTSESLVLDVQSAGGARRVKVPAPHEPESLSF